MAMTTKRWMALVAITLGGTTLLTIAALCFAIWRSIDFAPKDFANYAWVKTPFGFSAIEAVQRGQKICLCEGYECTANVETVHVIYQGWLRPYIKIVKDPEAGNDPSWGRPVSAQTTCLQKEAGETLNLKLTQFRGQDSAATKEITHLLMEIE